MLDMNPGDDGKVGQIICYIHDPDEVVYVAPSFGGTLFSEGSMMRYYTIRGI